MDNPALIIIKKLEIFVLLIHMLNIGKHLDIRRINLFGNFNAVDNGVNCVALCRAQRLDCYFDIIFFRIRNNKPFKKIDYLRSALFKAHSFRNSSCARRTENKTLNSEISSSFKKHGKVFPDFFIIALFADNSQTDKAVSRKHWQTRCFHFLYVIHRFFDQILTMTLGIVIADSLNNSHTVNICSYASSDFH